MSRMPPLLLLAVLRLSSRRLLQDLHLQLLNFHLLHLLVYRIHSLALLHHNGRERGAHVVTGYGFLSVLVAVSACGSET